MGLEVARKLAPEAEEEAGEEEQVLERLAAEGEVVAEGVEEAAVERPLFG